MKKIWLIAFVALAGLILLSGCPAPPEECSEDWRCSEWTTCTDGQQMRECVDIMDCGTKLAKPSETQSCTGPVVDLCEGITCADRCEGTTLMKNGACNEGECRYTTVENSTDCGYVEAQVRFDAELRFCEYSTNDRDFDMFFSIWTIGDRNPSTNSAIWLVTDNPNYNQPFSPIETQYEKGDLLWEKTMWSGIPYKGQMWSILSVPTFEDLDFQLVYCETDDPYKTECTPSNGVVIYRGNTKVDCEEVVL